MNSRILLTFAAVAILGSLEAAQATVGTDDPTLEVCRGAEYPNAGNCATHIQRKNRLERQLDALLAKKQELLKSTPEIDARVRHGGELGVIEAKVRRLSYDYNDNKGRFLEGLSCSHILACARSAGTWKSYPSEDK